MSDGYDWGWVDAENEVEEPLDWDDPRISMEELRTSFADRQDIGSQLIEYFGGAKNINFGRYPRSLQFYFRSCVARANAHRTRHAQEMARRD